MLDVNTGKLLQTEDKWQTPISRQRGRPTEKIQQFSENNLRTESNIWSQVPEWARYVDILADWPSVVMWLRLPGWGSLRWDSKVWLWVLCDSEHWVIALQFTDPFSVREGAPQKQDGNLQTAMFGKEVISCRKSHSWLDTKTYCLTDRQS
jgi:hypothetical protein